MLSPLSQRFVKNVSLAWDIVSNTHYGALVNINSEDLDIITHFKILDTVWNSSKLTTELFNAFRTSQLCFILAIDPPRFFSLANDFHLG